MKFKSIFVVIIILLILYYINKTNKKDSLQQVGGTVAKSVAESVTESFSGSVGKNPIHNLTQAKAILESIQL